MASQLSLFFSRLYAEHAEISHLAQQDVLFNCITWNFTSEHRLPSSMSPSAHTQPDRQPMDTHRPVHRLPQEQVLVLDMMSAQRLHNAHYTIHTTVSTEKTVSDAYLMNFPKFRQATFRPMDKYHTCLVVYSLAPNIFCKVDCS